MGECIVCGEEMPESLFDFDVCPKCEDERIYPEEEVDNGT